MIGPTKAVFLSYASQDVAAATRICEDLRAAGIEVWFDQSELRGGDAWEHQIRKRIQDCVLFVPLISAHTQARTEGYFRLEWHLADQRRLLMSKGRPFLVPVCIDDTLEASAEVPDSFNAVQWTRLPAEGATEPFVAHLARLLSPGERAQLPLARAPSGETPSWGTGALEAANRRRRKFFVLLAAVATLAGAYIVADRNWLSKRLPALPAPVPESTANPVSEKSIAVLPFVDMSEKKDQEYFSDGLAEELLGLLAKTPGLHVTARTSSFSFKGKSDDISTIASKLHVANILEGSVRKSGGRLRVTTQLVLAKSGESLWSETYDRELKDVFAVQDEIAAAVVRRLKLTLSPAPPAGVHRASNVEAYNQYLLGQQFSKRGNLEGYKLAIEAYRRSLVFDPSFVSSYGGLAVAEYLVADDTADVAGYHRAEAAADKAVALGPDDSHAYAARAFIRHNLNWDCQGALQDAEKAIALDPGDVHAQKQYGNVLGSLDRLPEAIAAAKKAAELDPLSAAPLDDLIFIYSSLRDFPAAQDAARRSLEISPDSVFGLKNLAALQLLEAKPADALATSRKILAGQWRLYGIAMAQYSLKDPKASQQSLDQLIAQHSAASAYQIADVYAWRDEKDKAFEWLERAYTQRDAGLVNIKIDPLVDALRGDTRYTVLLHKLKLPE